MQPVDQGVAHFFLFWSSSRKVHSTHSFRFQSEDAMVPFSPAQPDALPILTVLFCLAQSDALPRLGLSLFLDLMIEANCYRTLTVSW